ncbi:hypothetical protein HYU21_03530 [Candidatus Woesearchaeota archaeon]|nr:hypothetical protein [Candidatus Woesearchaeota archaeon]
MNDGLFQIMDAEKESANKYSPEEISRHNFEIKRKLALENLEMREHQYYLGEKRHCEVSLDDAIIDFTENNGSKESYAAQFERNYIANKLAIYEACDNHCGENVCKGFGKCDLPMNYVHSLLRD